MASIDWLEFSIKFIGPHAAIGLVTEVLGPAFGKELLEIDVETERKFMARGPDGFTVRADAIGSVNRHGVREPWVSLCLPGTACRAAGTKRLLVLLAGLAVTPGVKVSRMDVAFDDYTKSFSPRKFGMACVGRDLSAENGRLLPGVITRVKPDNWTWDRRLGGCFWLGAHKSERGMRVYDKNRESDGQIDAVRVELQCRNRFATELAWAIVKGLEEGKSLAEITLPFLVSFVDLRKPNGSRSRSQEWPRLKWWGKFVGQASAAATGGEDLTHVLAWERNCCLQSRGFVSVQLRSEGLTLRGYKGLRRDGCSEAAAVRALDRIMAGELVPLSKRQRERLRQLQKVRGARVETENPR